jgi:hypothetical protein
VPAEQQEERDRDEPDAEPAQRGGDRHVDHDVLHLVDRRPRVAGDEGVALDELLDRADLGLAEGQGDPQGPDVAEPEVRQQGPGLHHGVLCQRGADDGVVADEDHRPRAGEEERDRHDQPQRDAERHQRGADQQPPGGGPHVVRACEIA